jgi:hypothetical protein
VINEEALQIHLTSRPQEAGMAFVAQPCYKQTTVLVDILFLGESEARRTAQAGREPKFCAATLATHRARPERTLVVNFMMYERVGT